MLSKRHLFSTLLFLFLSVFTVYATEVPQYMEFAGMKLRILESARKKISADVEALQSNPKYFQMKVERIDMYFPIIEKILEEEGLPDDFKYLVVQESSLISDAVSTSNAVGYWQFKKESALEVGMIVDNDVDERKHIVAATRGAARYLKRNNYFLQNWIYTLQSYNMGLGGTQRSVNQRHFGAEKMDIDGNTHWYVLKFLAHKIAFEDAIGKSTQLPLTLLQYPDCQGKTLEQIASELDIPLADLELYNKWLNRKRVPEDKDYIVIIPASSQQAEVLLAKFNNAATPASPETEEVILVAHQANLNAAFPVLKEKKHRLKGNAKVIWYTVNGKPGIQAQPGDNIAKLSQKANISREKFLMYNDLRGNETIIPGEVYYLRKKKNKARVEAHIVTEGETLWKVSQMYGITVKALMRKNRMKRPEKLQHGRVLWMRHIRPANQPIEIRNIPKPATVIASSRSTAKVPTTNLSTRQAASTPNEKQGSGGNTGQKTSIEAPAVTPSAQAGVPVKEPRPQVSEQTASAMQEIKVPVKEEKVEVAQAEVIQPEVNENSKLHTVTSGQTLFAISKLYNISVSQIRLWNNLQDGDAIKTGQILKVSGQSETNIPAAMPPAVEFDIYTVQSGDSLYKIAKLYAVSVQELQDWNEKKDHRLAIGEKLKIKKSR